MSQSRFALITFLDGPYPDNSLPGHQPGVTPPLFPSNPIAPGGTTPPWGINSDRPSHPIYYPPGIWGPNDPRPGYGLPEGGPGRPPGTWGGANEPFPGYGLPGQPPTAGQGPGFPTPPIVIVGDGAVVAPPAAGVPLKGTLTFIEGKGYVFKVDSTEASSEGEA